MQKSETIPLLVQEDFDDCPLIRDLLPLYLEGEVTPASRDMITTHLSDCAGCATFLAGAQSMQSQLRHQPLQCATSSGKAVGITPKQPVAGIRSGTVAQPADQALPSQNPWNRVLDTIIVMGLYLGGVCSVIFVIEKSNLQTVGIGLMFAWLVLYLFLVIACKYGPLTLGRMILLGLGCILGALRVLFFPHTAYLLDFIQLSCISLALIWIAVFQGCLIPSLAALSIPINHLGRSLFFISILTMFLCIGAVALLKINFMS